MKNQWIGLVKVHCVPPDVQPFLERTEIRIVNKFREVSYDGYKIQVDLLPKSKIMVVDMLETLRIE